MNNQNMNKFSETIQSPNEYWKAAYAEEVQRRFKDVDYLQSKLNVADTIITATANAFLALQPGLPFEGGIDAAMSVACAEIVRLRAEAEQLTNAIRVDTPNMLTLRSNRPRRKAEAEVERLTKHCSALEVEVAVLSEGLSEDHAIYIANARAEKAEAQVEQMKDYAYWKDAAKTRTENLERASEQMLAHEDTIIRLRAEVERLTKGNLDMGNWVVNKNLQPEWDSFKKSLEVIDHWKARAEKAEADTARLDWLEKEALQQDWGPWSMDRATIDAAMKESIEVPDPVSIEARNPTGGIE